MFLLFIFTWARGTERDAHILISFSCPEDVHPKLRAPRCPDNPLQNYHDTDLDCKLREGDSDRVPFIARSVETGVFGKAGVRMKETWVDEFGGAV